MERQPTTDHEEAEQRKEEKKERGEFLGLKLRRGIAAGKKGGAHTPVPTWKMEDDDVVEHDGGVGEAAPTDGRRRRSSVSARQLGASLWEIQDVLPRNRIGRRGAGAHRQRNGKEIADEILNRPNSSASLRRQVAASFIEHHRAKERTGRAPQPVSPVSYSSSVGAGVVNHTMTPSCSTDIKANYSLKTSTELLKVLNRIWTLEEQHTSHISLIKSMKLELQQAKSRIREMEGLLNQISDEKLIRKSKEKEKIKIVREELEEERRLRKHSEGLYKKLGKEISELKSAFIKSVKDLEREKKANCLLEELCDEFARGIRDYEEEVRDLKQKSGKDFGHNSKFDKSVLHIAEAWLDEREQMQIAESRGDLNEKNTILDQLSGEIQAFLQTRLSSSKIGDKCDKIEQNYNYRRQSLESVHLNGTTSAPRVTEEDGDDSVASDVHCFELDMHATQLTKNGKEKLEYDSDEKLIIPFKETVFPISDGGAENNSREIARSDIVMCNVSGKSKGENASLLNARLCDGISLGHFCNSIEKPDQSAKLHPGMKENTLKAKLIQARLEGRHARLKASVGPAAGRVRK